MTKVNEERIEMLTTAFNRYDFSEKYNFTIYRKNSHGENRVEFEINWSAIGSVSPKVANEFATNLMKASSLVTVLNGMELEAEEACIPTWTNKEMYENDYRRAVDATRALDTAAVITWLLK